MLRAYQRVLAATGLDPAADTRYYRTLLRLSLDAGEPCWWGRLFREISTNCRCGMGWGCGWKSTLPHHTAASRWMLLLGAAPHFASSACLVAPPSLNPALPPIPSCRRYGTPPEQQQALMSVLLRCRLGGSPAVAGEAAEEPGAAEWAQEVVAASRPGSARGGGAPPLPMWGDKAPASEHCVQQPPSALQVSPVPAAATAAAGLDPAASFASLPPGLESEAQRAHSLEQAVAAWQAAASPVQLLPQDESDSAPMQQQQVSSAHDQQLQQALLAWQTASLASAAQQQQQQAECPARMDEGKAEALSHVSVEDAVTGCSRASPAGQPSGLMVRVAVPPPLPLAQPPLSPAPLELPTDTFASPARPQPAYPAAELPGWAPWLASQASPAPSSVRSKYPPIWYTPHAPYGPADAQLQASWLEAESPRILAYPEPSGVAEPAAALKAAVAAAGVPGGIAPKAAIPAEQLQVLHECLVAWHGLASAVSAARRAAELRGCAQAEEFWEAQLLRRCFRAWRHRRLAVVQAVLAHFSSAAQRHAFLKVGSGKIGGNV